MLCRGDLAGFFLSLLSNFYGKICWVSFMLSLWIVIFACGGYLDYGPFLLLAFVRTNGCSLRVPGSGEATILLTFFSTLAFEL